jgi:hypothetical protein
MKVVALEIAIVTFAIVVLLYPSALVIRRFFLKIKIKIKHL